MKPEIKDLFAAASAARDNSYSPYSRYAVGSAVRMGSGKIYSGCNVENASYGAAICAERSAITKAISEEGDSKIRDILVVTESSPPAPPCGLCLQVIAEFGSDATIYSINPKGEMRNFTLKQLLPETFSRKNLNQ